MMLMQSVCSYRSLTNSLQSALNIQTISNTVKHRQNVYRQLQCLAASHRHNNKNRLKKNEYFSTHRHNVTLSTQLRHLPRNSTCLYKFPPSVSNIDYDRHYPSVSHVRYMNTRQILEKCPSNIQPYLRLIRFDRPIGTYLLFWPCSWSIGLAASAGYLPDLYLLALFAAGSFFMRGAGCIINDMWDQDIDKKVARTKSRPLASGELTQFNALVMLACNLSVSLAILLQLNWYSVFLGAASMGLVIVYPLAKRFTYWPQIVLGLTFNYGAMLGWCAVNGQLAGPILPLYISCLLWTLSYDTIYAHQDKEDDMLIGVKSTALKFGTQTKPWLSAFSTGMVGNLALTGYLCDQTWPYYTAVAATAAHLAHQLYTVDLDNHDDCLKKFKSNTQIGVIMFLGIVIGTLLKPKAKQTDSQTEKISLSS